MTEILLATNENNGKTRAEMKHFGNPLLRGTCQLCNLAIERVCSEHRTFSLTLSSESGESIEKQIRMTCESGYERGRSRS